MSDPIYINGIFVREKTGQFGAFLNVSIDLEQLNAQAKEYGNGRTLNVVISPRRTASKTGVTHSVRLDTYSKENGTRHLAAAHRAADSAPQGQFADVPNPPPAEGEDSVPF